MENKVLIIFLETKIKECERDKKIYGKYDQEQWMEFENKKQAFQEILDYLNELKEVKP